jgi:cytochrome bd-type quinol oxidase subunit 2
MVGYLVLCLVFIRKDKEYVYTKLDKNGIIFNFLTGIIVVPFLSLICMMFGLVENRVELINQITYSIPPIAILCLALSVVFRRKGYSKPGFFIQFTGIALFILILILDSVSIYF